MSRFDTDTGGLIYPKAIKQLFTGLYVMEIYLIGLFFLLRDKQSKPPCIGQGTIMIVVLLFTVVYQTLLTQAYEPLLQNLPVMLKDILDSADPEQKGTRRKETRGVTGQRLLDAVDRFDMLDTVLGRSDARSRGFDESLARGHGAPCEMRDQATVAQQPVIWLPRDDLGISDDEISRTKEFSGTIRISNRNACLDGHAKVEVHGPPPSYEDALEPRVNLF